MLVGQVVNKMPAMRLGKKDPTLLDSDTLLGLEVEVENFRKNLPSTDPGSTYWTAQEDNSLRNMGIEFVFTEPLYGADVVEAIKYLCTKAREFNYAVSERTGLHVHMDVRNMELSTFRSMCAINCLVEPLVYHWVGDMRERNIHCLPWYMADMDIDSIGSIFTKKPGINVISTIKQLNRYTGFNLASLTKFGTVEYRQLRTTFDERRIFDWLNILFSIKKAATIWQGTADDLIEEAINLGPYTFAYRVFGLHLTSKVWYQDYTKDLFNIAIPTAEHFLEASRDYTSIGGNKGLTDKDIYDKFAKATQDQDEEFGDNPTVQQWLAKNKKKKSTIHRTLDEFMVLSNVPQPVGVVVDDPLSFPEDENEEGENS